MTETTPTIRGVLRRAPIGARVGITFALLTLLIGLVASYRHLVGHHEGRDGQPGMTMIDLQGAYHGVKSEAPLRRALRTGHPETLGEARRDILTKWLDNPAFESFDNFDLGDDAPAAIIDAQCLSCHSRSATVTADASRRARDLYPLDRFEDVTKLAAGVDLRPAAEKILLASTHTHAIALGCLTLILCGFGLCTRWPRTSGAFGALAGFALLADIVCWWASRSYLPAVYIIAGAGFTYMLATVLQCLLSMADMWLPVRAGSRRE